MKTRLLTIGIFVVLALAAASCHKINEGDDKYVIDAEQCVECGSCAAACPVEAIEL